MSKYVIELDDASCSRNSGQTIRFAKEFNTLCFDEFGMTKLSPLEPIVESAVKEGFKVGYAQGVKSVVDTTKVDSNNIETKAFKELWQYVCNLVTTTNFDDDGMLLKNARSVYGSNKPGWQIRHIFENMSVEEFLARTRQFYADTEMRK